MALKTFSERVVELALRIPPGRVSAYRDLARAAGGGDIMNLSSEITLDDMPMMTLYATTKNGLNGFTKAMGKRRA